GGLSAALTCIQRGLSYVVLEKEQMIASTIARYPKGKLVMAEPYDTMNLSFLPVFDSAKEQLIPIWQELIQRVQCRIKQGESVEAVTRSKDGTFEIRSTVSTYRAQRVVLSIGTRGKPRTLQVPGENLPKVYSLLDDPDEWRGRSVLVVGGGDSACEAALALADAGAKVTISYRGKGFNRAAPKNKQTIEAYAAEGRIKAKLGSQVLQFEPDSVTLALADGTQKRYPNDAAFVLIGADPPIAWLEKMGIRFVQRPHQYQLGKTDDIVRRFVQRATECPEDAARAAAQILGGSVGFVAEPAVAAAAAMGMPLSEPVSGPRKWLRSATSIFSTKTNTNPGAVPTARSGEKATLKTEGKGKKFDVPVPLSEFAKRGREKSQGTNGGQSTGVHHQHTGHGRRDQLSAGERTRILRMLRDEGGRLADEDSEVYIGAAPGKQDYDFDFDDGPAEPPRAARADVPAKPAVVVGIQQAQNRKKKPSLPPPPPGIQPATRPPPPPGAKRAPTRATAAPSLPRRPVPPPFSDEPTRQVDDDILNALRTGQVSRGDAPRGSVRPAPVVTFNEEATRLAPPTDARAIDEAHREKFPANAPATDPSPFTGVDSYEVEEATSISSYESIAAMERTRHQGNDERTRA
ncbi:MAG TPA: NAD(P)-binding domain-containing protein, partial [Kofleriaceae bacterium]|nr:NAD(P)-binding domain-containing protein [Kofleriaceae bacterium]